MTSRRARVIPAVVALAGSGLLVYWTSTARPLWVDEEMLLLNVRDRGFPQLAGPLWLDQSAPLGWLILERLVLRMLGPSEPAVRLLTVAFGAATLATAAWIGRRWMSVAGAAVFVALCAIGEWLVFFTLELKHYSADTFGSLLVPAAAAWVLDAASRPVERRRRLVSWWLLVALAQWFSNGALFVTPLCAVVIIMFTRRMHDRRAGTIAVAGTIVWGASFALNDAVVLRHAAANPYLQNYWAFAFPPVSQGVGPTLSWIVAQLAPFARKPASSGWPILFWLVWLAGVTFAIAARRKHALMILTVPASALGLALFHVVPPFERLGLWVVPSLYAGVGYGVDMALALVPRTSPRTRVVRLAMAAATGLVVLTVSGDIVRRGAAALAHRPHSNYGLDDRSSIRWLLAAHQPGDALLTTHFGLAALWWYGRIDVSDAGRSGTRSDGSRMFEIGHAPLEGDCLEWRRRLDAALAGRTRAVVYLGFRLNVEPVGFDNLLLQELGRRGALESYKEYAEESRLAVFDLTHQPANAVIVPDPDRRFPITAAGCVAIRPAARW